MSARTPVAAVCLSLLATGLAACGGAVSTSGFHGEQQQVAQAVAHLQSHATALEAKKICGEDFAAAARARLNAAGGCKKALETQLKQIDNFEVTVKSVAIAGSTATARVQSIHAGKNAIQALTLVKEGGKWRISSLS